MADRWDRDYDRDRSLWRNREEEDRYDRDWEERGNRGQYGEFGGSTRRGWGGGMQEREQYGREGWGRTGRSERDYDAGRQADDWGRQRYNREFGPQDRGYGSSAFRDDYEQQAGRGPERGWNRGREQYEQGWPGRQGGQGWQGEQGWQGGRQQFGRQGAQFGGRQQDWGQQDWGQEDEWNPSYGQGQGSAWQRGPEQDYGRQGFGRGQDFGRGQGLQRGQGFGRGQGQFGQGQLGQGQFGQGRFGQGQYGQSQYGQGQYGRGFEQGRQGQGFGGEQDWESEQGPWTWTYTEYWLIPGPFTGMGPSGYKRSTERVQEDICERLTQHGRLDASNIEVQVNENGEVTLTGTVDSREAKRMAEEAAEGIPGVQDVHNQLRVQQRQQQQQQQGMGQSGQQQSGQVGQSGQTGQSAQTGQGGQSGQMNAGQAGAAGAGSQAGTAGKTEGQRGSTQTGASKK